MTTAFPLETHKRLEHYRLLSGTVIIISVLTTWNLWSADRTCPTAPLLGVHSFIYGSYGYIFKGLLIFFSLLFILRVRYAEWFLAALFIIGFTDDFNRLLPDTYHYGIILILFGLLKTGGDDTLLSGLRIMQAGTYLWTGILKLNSNFIDQISGFMYMTLHIQHPPAHLRYLILIVPLCEIAIGIAFLSGKKTGRALLSALVLHIVISLFLLISHWNRPIITYNLFLAAGNFFLFSKSSIPLIREIEKPRAWIQKIAVVLFIILPALNLGHWWPDFMSCSLYSCRSLNAIVYIDENLKKQLPNEVLPAVFNSPKGQYISITYWIQNETGSVPNPQKLVYDKMFSQFLLKYNCDDSVKLVVY